MSATRVPSQAQAPLKSCPPNAEECPPTARRADLHVHSYHSRVNGNMPFLKSRDCYSPPEDVYRVAKARGMDFVTITDHDSIDGCLEYLDRHPDARDFIIGEEVSCRMPEGDIEVHVAVYGTDEALHRDLQPLRGNVFEVTALLRERGAFFVLNHLLHFYRGQVPLASYLRLLGEFPALEARNGTMLRAHNELIEQLAATGWAQGGSEDPPLQVLDGRALGGRGGSDGDLGGRGGSLDPPWRAADRQAPKWTTVGGSDAHTLRRVGTTWTEAPGGTTAQFLASLVAGRARVGGLHGGAGAVIGDVYGVIGRYVGSLLGAGPQDHGVVARTLCLAFSLGSLPFQFIPALIALSTVRQQSRVVARAIDELATTLERIPKTTAIETERRATTAIETGQRATTAIETSQRETDVAPEKTVLSA